MKKIKNVTRLLLESGFTRKEIKELQKNAKLYGIDLASGVKDVGGRMLKASIIVGGVFLAFFIAIIINKPLHMALFFSIFWLIILLFSCFFTNIPRYTKSVIFYFKFDKKTS